MTHVKKLIMQGFKSFAPRTELVFDNGINLFVGPNGSGKSNISDALCFALGRISAKSMRASKSGNLLFMGSKYAKPAKEAFVELTFENSNNTFALPVKEVSIKRIVKRSGQSTYQLNGETKTRGEVLETLAQAGIDPYGFNIILQGNIHSLVRAHPEERRKIIEEVAGISIYESRKEKSLHELEKTESRLKEISTILRERTSVLNNLERERAQALRFKELETTVKRCKASLIQRKLDEKNRELSALKKSISEKLNQKDKIKSKLEETQQKINSFNEKISQISRHIQKSTGIEQESLHTAISNLRAELEGLRVRSENYENRKREIENRIEQMQSSIPEMQSEIQNLREESPLIAKKQQELQKKKKELEQVQEQRKTAYALKTQLSSLKERIKDKQVQSARAEAESSSLLKQLEELSIELKYKTQKECSNALALLSEKFKSAKANLLEINKSHLEKEKIMSISESIISEAEKTKQKVNELELCPLCQTKITHEHVKHVFSNSDLRISAAKKAISEAQKELEKIKERRQEHEDELAKLEKDVSYAREEISSHEKIKDRQEYLKKILEQEEILKSELKDLESKRANLENKTFNISQLEESYSDKLREIEEVSSRTEENIDTTLLFKERELERMRDVIKQSNSDFEELQDEIEEINSSLEQKESALEQKEKEEAELSEKFKKLLAERDSYQEKIKEESYVISEFQTSHSQIEEQVNYLKVGDARLDAEKDSLEMDLKDFVGVELIKASPNVLEDRLIKTQDALNSIGSINMRALEVYEQVKEEYDKVKEKSDLVEKEKLEVLKIIEEIDRKKKRTFMKTFNAVNELFSQNFSKLYTKGRAYLELENNEAIFEGGVNIVIKIAKGKYFDVASLSGGEQTLVAISLLFAIQEYKPYHFYIFDEIDAALDKRNSQRLSALLKQYMKNGQYIVITHNDAIITDSNILYGVSMQDGISKVLSLKLD